MASLTKTYKSKKQIEEEEALRKEEAKKLELTPKPEERIEMLETMILSLMFE